MDEYYQVQTLDPSKLPAIQAQIWNLIVQPICTTICMLPKPLTILTIFSCTWMAICAS
jgi:hypothetical protein